MKDKRKEERLINQCLKIISDLQENLKYKCFYLANDNADDIGKVLRELIDSE